MPSSLSEEASSALSDYDGSSFTESLNDTRSEQISLELARRETQVVRRLKLTVAAVLVVSAVAVSVSVFLFLRKGEQDDFEVVFEDFSQSIVDAFHEDVERRFEALDSLKVAIMSYERNVHAEWPYVMVPDFEIRGATTLSLAEALFVMFSPIVTNATRAAYENYTLYNQDWIEAGIEWQNKYNEDHGHRGLEGQDGQSLDFSQGHADRIFRLDGQGQPVVQDGPGPYVPVWQSAPVVPLLRSVVNFDLMSQPAFRGGLQKLLDSKEAVISELWDYGLTNDTDDVFHQFLNTGEDNFTGDPVSSIFYPVFDDFDENHELVGVITMEVHWVTHFLDKLPPHADGVICVLENTCGQAFTYEIFGQDAVFLGDGDLHDGSYQNMVKEAEFADFLKAPVQSKTYSGVPVSSDYCHYHLSIFPSNDLAEDHLTNKPIIFTFAVVIIFVFTALVFAAYDWSVERRQTVVAESAAKSNAIVSSLFPSTVRERLYNTDKEERADDLAGGSSHDFVPKRLSFKKSLDTSTHSTVMPDVPIADSFPRCSVFFCDVAGFTAWSSEREPAQVFMLLETIYGEFDAAAKRRGVFKIETIGDCYVAVTGLPRPQEQHALIMVRFAHECRQKMAKVTRKLEAVLGPDTGELSIRIGIHSGPVTAGVLRGEKSRFQLFGDTVNTASRMESNGQKGKIHVSQETADLLIKAGKGHWVHEREDKVHAKGKGELTTFFIEPKTGPVSSHSSGASSGASSETSEDFPDDISGDFAIDFTDWSAEEVGKINRLVDWNVDLLITALRKVISHRDARGLGLPKKSHVLDARKAGDAFKEFTSIIKLRDFDPKIALNMKDPELVELPDDVRNQLRLFVLKIASMYKRNPFHNFEHASHVMMSVQKLLKRVVLPEDLSFNEEDLVESSDDFIKNVGSDLHDCTYGINSDPLIQMALLFCALIHDVDHRGVSNPQLAKENPDLAALYKSRSLAEQNSLDIAWELLMEDVFSDLRRYMFATKEDLKRFRQLLVNVVIATDIFDKELSALRKERWTKAFSAEVVASQSSFAKRLPSEEIHRKATVVLEHIMQASDVAHTMQHWFVYCKWNQRLFNEMYSAYQSGRMEKDPSDGWYRGEIMFFDHYVIPLAEKLSNCKVFGVESDQCLKSAISNREEWVRKGEELVANMVLAAKGAAET